MATPQTFSRLRRNDPTNKGGVVLGIGAVCAFVTLVAALFGIVVFVVLRLLTPALISMTWGEGPTTAPDVSEAILPPEFEIISSRFNCGNSGCWNQLEILNNSSLSNREVVENLPNVQKDMLDGIWNERCKISNNSRFRNSCTYIRYRESTDTLSVSLSYQPTSSLQTLFRD